MMELTCAFILIAASFVSATPHGYGVKGGVSSRAESSASSGAFGPLGGLPIPVPLGASYSGSFSKSSSSSSSSSSASSSSSSSSFSYSGSGAGGLGLHGGAQGNGGCSSGSCPTAGGSEIATPHDSAAGGYNSASAAATAGAGAVSGSGCQGQSCDNTSGKCASGQCKPKTTSIYSDSNKCTSGKCETGTSPTNDDSNDIRVFTDTSDSDHNAKDQSPSVAKTTLAYESPGSDCFQKNCGPSVPLSSKPNHYGYETDHSYQGSSASNKQQASNLDTGITSHYQTPSTHLETPKLSSKCNSGSCNGESDQPKHATLPSSYNVPIHGVQNGGDYKPSCDGVKCENQPKGSYSPTSINPLSTNYLNPQNSVTKEPSAFNNPSSANCGGSSCSGLPANQFNQGSPKPGSSYATNPAAGSGVATGHIGKPSNDKLPVYTGGFGGPAGILNPNEFNVAVPIGKPNHDHANTPQNGKPLGSYPTSCNSPSCSGYPSASRPNVPTGTYGHNPGGEVPSEKLPTYTGGFGGPAGTLKPNELHNHEIPPNRPTVSSTACLLENCAGTTPGTTAPSGYYDTTKPIASISSPSEKLPTYTGGFGGPAGTLEPNELHNQEIPPKKPTTPGTTAPSGPFGPTKPVTGISTPNEKLPTYTGGFGGPGGVLFNPNELHVAAPSGNPSYAHASTSQNGKPLGSIPINCNSPSCSRYPSASGPVPTGTYNQNPDAKVSTGLGGPTGTLKPNKFNDYTIPQNQRPTIGLATACLKGNCGIKSGTTTPSVYLGTSEKLPTYTGGFGGPGGNINPENYDVHTTGHSSFGYTSSGHPSGCKTRNCYPTLDTHAQTESFDVSRPSSGPHLSSVTLPAYPSSYDKPSGANDVSTAGLAPGYSHTQSPSSPGSYSTGCTTGNCAIFPTYGPSADAHTQPGYGITKPNTNVNSAGSTLPQYTGGFGGPPSTLKPSHDHTYVTPATGPTSCSAPNCAPTASGVSTSGANAQSGSFGILKPGSGNPSNGKPIYTGSFGGPSGTLKPSHAHTYVTPATGPTNCGTPNCAPTASGVAISGATSQSSPGSYSPGCKTGNCAIFPTNGPSADAHTQPEYGVTKPNTNVNAAGSTLPQYTGGFGGPPGTLKPSHDHTYVTPATGPTSCSAPNCVPTASGVSISGANTQSGSFGILKPGSGNPSNGKPIYAGGFGGPSGVLKPDDYSLPTVSSTLNNYNKPLGAPTPAACTSGSCNPHVPHGSATQSHSSASNGAHATAAATAEANAVVYTGGFGGPPGVLEPFDDAKIGASSSNGGQPQGSQIDRAHYSSHNANIHSPHGTLPAANSGPTGPVGSGALFGSSAGSLANAGAAAGTFAAAHGYSLHGSSHNPEGNIKGGKPCGGGCGGAEGGYNGAAAKSLAGATAFGGSYASSSASAHASAGAYNKGGYGKR